MLTRRSDLPWQTDQQARFLPWLTAFMVFLATLALAGMLVLHAAVAKWDTGVEGTFTVQVAPGATDAEDESRLAAVLSLLAAEPDIARYETLTEDRLLALLEPWIGEESAASGTDLPLPRLIDVTLVPGADLSAVALTRTLSARVPRVAVDDHRVWMARILRLIDLVKGAGWAVLGFIAVATIGTVIFTTKTGLAIHRDAIEVLHLIGAQDSYIARQFAARAMALGLKGGVFGLALAVPILAGAVYLAREAGETLLPQPETALWQGGLILSLPLIVAVIARMAARSTVMRNLKRMM